MNHPHYAAAASKQPVILVIDADNTVRMMLSGMVEALGYAVLEATNGKEALDTLLVRHAQIDVVLLDRSLPVLDGMALTMRMKAHPELRSLPIIMQTSADRPEQIKQGIDAGVFYYLTKPVNQDVLKSVLIAAIRENHHRRLISNELQKHRSSFQLVDTCQLQLRTLAEAEHMAMFLANYFPDAQRVVSGLSELLVNAVEHGNLGIGYDDKTYLIEHGNWRNEIERREMLPEHMHKRVSIVFRKKPESSCITITDEGSGFEWKQYLQIDPSRASHSHGRGIAQANALSFDSITFNDAGNSVTASITHEKPLEW